MFSFSKEIGIDLGTANTLVCLKGKGIILREPSVVAVDIRTDTVLAVGSQAKDMIGRTPNSIVAVRPLKDGVIADFKITAKMLQHFIKKSVKPGIFSKPRVIICMPTGVTEVERKAVEDAAYQAGAKPPVILIEEPMAAAIGAGLPVDEPTGSMVVDIGGGTSEVAVISLGDIVSACSVRVAGDKFDEAILSHIKKQYNLLIGERTAEDIKIKIGSVWERPEEITATIRGRDAKTGMPREVMLTSTEIFEVLRRPARQIADEVVSVLEDASPELVSDIAESGITLTGGSSQLWGMAQLIEARTGIACTIADDPDSCVAYGCGKSLSWMNHMSEGVINIAKKRIMRT